MNELNSYDGYGFDQNSYGSNETNFYDGSSQNSVGYNISTIQSDNNYIQNSQSFSSYVPNNNLSTADNKKKLRISFNSPAVLSFAIMCFVVLIIQYIFGDDATLYVFSVYRVMTGPATLGHASTSRFC